MTFSRTFARAAGAALLLAAVSLPAAAQETRAAQRAGVERETAGRAPARVPAATILFCETNDVRRCTDGNEFALDDLRDLFVFVSWREVRGEHIEALRFTMPDGHVYQTTETKFTTLPSASKEDVQRAALNRGVPTVMQALPVAGTHITQRSLAGTWNVDAFLDGKLMASRTFLLKPREQQ